MKEYVAEAGGRYTYVDDILNLQELTLSMTSIFTDCANFIISGCEVVSDNEITSGYVWINKKRLKGGEIIICVWEVRQNRLNHSQKTHFNSLRLLPHTHPDL